MNCEVVQKQLLGSESPDRPSAEASAHLATCGGCREWLQRLLQLESAAAHLPVPRSDTARSALIHRILTQPAAKKPGTGEQRRPSIAIVIGSWILDPRASKRRRVGAGLVAGVAAALLLFVTSWLIWYSTSQPQLANTTLKGPPRDQLLMDLERYKIKVAEIDTPKDRINAMADAADDLYRQSSQKDASANDVIAMTQLYGRVLQEGILRPAEALSADERAAVLRPIATRLHEANSQWSRLSQQTGLSPQVKAALAKAAVAALDSGEQLQKLCDAA